MKSKSDILAQFGERLRELRKQQGLSQEAFADLCGLDRTYVGGVERGERNVALRNIAAMAKALNISISTLTEDIESS